MRGRLPLFLHLTSTSLYSWRKKNSLPTKQSFCWSHWEVPLCLPAKLSPELDAKLSNYPYSHLRKEGILVIRQRPVARTEAHACSEESRSQASERTAFSFPLQGTWPVWARAASARAQGPGLGETNNDKRVFGQTELVHPHPPYSDPNGQKSVLSQDLLFFKIDFLFNLMGPIWVFEISTRWQLQSFD